MTSLSSRLPAYFVVPAALLEEDIVFFQGRGIPVSAPGNPESTGYSLVHSGRLSYLKPLALVLNSLSSAREQSKNTFGTPQRSPFDRRLPGNRVLKFFRGPGALSRDIFKEL